MTTVTKSPIAALILLAAIACAMPAAAQSLQSDGNHGCDHHDGDWDGHASLPSSIDVTWIPHAGANPILFVAAAPNPVAHGRSQVITVAGVNSLGDRALTLRIVDIVGRTVLDLTARLGRDAARGVATARFSSDELGGGAFFVCAQAGGVGALSLIHVAGVP